MRKIILLLGIIISILSLIYGFVNNFSTNVVLIFCLSAYMTIFGILMNKTIGLKALKLITIVLLTLLLAFNIFIFSYGRNDTVTYKEDAIIILGAGVKGETPSLTLQKRLDAGLKYYEKNHEVLIVVSGGQGPGEDITEALAMERYLVANGVPKEKILKEEKATTSCTNISLSKKILDQKFSKNYKTVIITNDFHIFRSVMIANKLGLETTHLHANTSWYSMPGNHLRETISILFQVILGC